MNQQASLEVPKSSVLPNGSSHTDGDDSILNKIEADSQSKSSSSLSRPRHPRDRKSKIQSPTDIQPANAIHRHSPIDFDGLSWPSKPL